MKVYFDLAQSSQQTNNSPNESESLLIPIACAAIAAVGLIGTISGCFSKREWTQAEAPAPRNETPPKPIEKEASPVRSEEPPPVGKSRKQERRTERNRLRRDKKGQKRSVSTDSESSGTLAVSSSGEASSSSASTPRSNRGTISSEEFIHTSYSDSSDLPSPREQEPLYISDSYIAMNIPHEQYTAFHLQAMELLGESRPFRRSDNPHITIADAEDTRHLTAKDKVKIQNDFKRLIQNKTLIPLQLKTVLHQAGLNQLIEEFLILDVAVSPELNNFRMSLLIDGYIRPDASMQHQNRAFHITLGRRYADQSKPQRELQSRLLSTPVLSTVNWPGARL